MFVDTNVLVYAPDLALFASGAHAETYGEYPLQL